ncbi:MAG: ATP-binding protein [Nitrososphaerales archaeon]
MFPTKGPVLPSQLIGRRDEVAALVSQLNAGNHQIVVGPRRTGKTSVCDAASAALRTKKAYVVSVDLFEVDTLNVLAERIALQAISNRPAVKKLLPALRRATARVGKAAQMSATLKHEFGTDIEFAFTPLRSQKTAIDQFDYSLHLLEKLAVSDGHPVVLYLDEFQEIEASGNRFGDPDLIAKKIRAILQRSPHVTCIFAGSIEHMMRGLFASKSRAMYQFGGFFVLSPILNDVWADGLRKVYKADKTSITDAALAHLLEVSGGAARATMLLAQQSHVVAVEKGVFTVDVTEVLQGIDYALAAEQPAHESEIVRIRGMRAHSLSRAQSIARSEPPYAAKLDAKQVGRALESLRKAGLIVQVETREWQFVDPLFRRYLERFSAL